MGYKDQVKQAIGLDSIPGFMVLKPDATTHRTELASWDEGKHTIIRILPEVVNGQPKPARNSDADNDFSDWIRAEAMVRKFGVNEKFTCLTRAKDAPDDPSPIEVFCRTVHKAVSTNDRSIPREWDTWCKGAHSKSPDLPKASKAGLVQCVVVERRGKPIVDEKTGRKIVMYPCVFVFTAGARWNLELLLNARVDNPDSAQTLDDYFQIGDFLGEGRQFRIDQVPYNPMTKAIAHYGISVVCDANSEPVPYGLPENVIQSWRPWDELLRFLTVKEQINIICRAFPPDVIDFAIGRTGFASYLPETVLGAWHRRSVDTGPMVAPSRVAQMHSAAVPRVIPAAPVQAEVDSPFVQVSEFPTESSEDLPFDTDDVPQQQPPRVAVKLSGPTQVTHVPSQIGMQPSMPSFDPAKSAISKNDIRQRLNAARSNKPQ